MYAGVGQCERVFGAAGSNVSACKPPGVVPPVWFVLGKKKANLLPLYSLPALTLSGAAQQLSGHLVCMQKALAVDDRTHLD